MAQFNLANFMRTHAPRNGEFFTVAIDGRGGSGKSSLADYLHSQLPSMLVVRGDDYFEPSNDAVLWGEFNDARFIHDVIEPLQQGPNFTYRPYDWHAEPHVSEQPMTVQQVFCLERCFSFGFELDWDLRIWVETPREVCLQRGLARDSEMGEARARAAWKIWQDREDKYIASSHPDQLSNWVLDGTQPFDTQVVLSS